MGACFLMMTTPLATPAQSRVKFNAHGEGATVGQQQRNNGDDGLWCD
jgi:hypothetical protein